MSRFSVAPRFQSHPIFVPATNIVAPLLYEGSEPWKPCCEWIITFVVMVPPTETQVDGVSDTSSISDPLDTRDDDGWEDLENDEESVTFKSLFDDQSFSSAQDMLAHCRDNHSFDIWKLKQDFGE
jgi:hypothetical protein